MLKISTGAARLADEREHLRRVARALLEAETSANRRPIVHVIPDDMPPATGG